MIVITNKMNKLTQKKNSITTIIQNTNNIIKDINKNRKQIEEEKITEKEVPSIITPETPKNENKNFSNSSSSESFIQSNTKEQIQEETNKNTTLIEIENKDNIVVSYFKDAQSKLENVNLRESAKENFITIVDFLFYGGTIKGYTFNELSSAAKLQILKIALTIDFYIDTYFPNYKETISKTTNKIYTSIKEKIIEKYLTITTAICKNDQSICEQAKSDFQQMKKSFSITWELVKNLAKSGTTQIKQWYEIYSGK